MNESQSTTTSDKISLKTEYFITTDYLAKILFKIAKGSSHRSALVGSLFYGIFWTILGLIISLVYDFQGFQFKAIYDQQEVIPHLFVVFFTIPIMWGFYHWQVQNIVFVINNLFDQSMLIEESNTVQKDHYIKILNLNRKLVFNRFAVLLTFVVTVFWIISISDTSVDSFNFGFSTNFWLINPIYFFGIFVPTAMLNLYIGSWILIRQGLAIYILNDLFQNFDLSIKLFHPDGSNGLAFLGNYAIRSASVAVFAGFWLLFMTLYPLTQGFSINLKLDTIIGWGLYIILVPLLLVPPVWSAHVAMKQDKNKKLEEIAQELRRLLSKTSASIQDIERYNLERDFLQNRYNTISTEYRTWPFDIPQLRRFTATAILPILSTASSLFLERILK